MDYNMIETKYEYLLYNWCLKEWHQQIDNDFSLLRKIKDDKVYAILEIMKNYDQNKQREFARILIMNNWNHLFDKWNIKYSKEDENKASKLHSHIWKICEIKKREKLQQKSKCLLPIKKVISIIRGPIENTTNSKCTNDGEIWEFTTSYDAWSIRTCILVDIEERQIDHTHLIHIDKSSICFPVGSYSTSLGVGRFWEYKDEYDLPDVAESFAFVLAYYMNNLCILMKNMNNIE